MMRNEITMICCAFIVIAAALYMLNRTAEDHQIEIAICNDRIDSLKSVLVLQQAQIDSLKTLAASTGAITVYNYERQSRLVPLVLKGE